MTKANTSHVYFRLFDQTLGAEMVLHSDMPGVVFRLFDEFKIKNFTTEEYEINDERLDQAVKDNLWHLGKKYHFFKLLDWSIFIIFKRWLIRKVKNPAAPVKKLICVDFLLYILNQAGITQLPIGYLTPKDFQKWCLENYESLGWKRKIFDDTPQWLK